MTTPRIEEILFRFRLDFPYTYDQVSEDMKETHETFLSKALTEAHQAGIDEAVEKILEYKFIYSDNEVCKNMADNLIEALQDNK